MGKRDFGRREPKKPKKDSKKPLVSEILAPPSTVEIIKKKKKGKGTEEEG
jgi:hypothetical protein